MEKQLIEKLNRIEQLLVELNSKIDNFLGFEKLEEKELKELNYLEREVRKGKFKSFHDTFGE